MGALTSVPVAAAERAAAAERPEGLLAAAVKLHAHLERHHWRDGRLVGPDVGVRFNSRIWRFPKSALRRFRWGDDMVYQQAQGYWILANLRLAALLGGPEAERLVALAGATARTMLASQHTDGSWPYPNREWRGRVATAEGTWSALGLLALYRHTHDESLLDGALRWHAYVHARIGFQEEGGTAAVNYFADRPGARVPNNTAFYLRFLAELEAAGGPADPRQAALARFMSSVQLPSGEFPYEAPGPHAKGAALHFQCFQYNAFISMDLLRYASLTGDATMADAALRTVGFLRSGLRQSGAASYSCTDAHRLVTYHSAALAAAFVAAAQAGLPGAGELARRAYRYVCSKQRQDGSFAFSSGDYRVLSDGRSYPRPQAMILYHLLSGAEGAAPAGPGGAP